MLRVCSNKWQNIKINKIKWQFVHNHSHSFADTSSPVTLDPWHLLTCTQGQGYTPLHILPPQASAPGGSECFLNGCYDPLLQFIHFAGLQDATSLKDVWITQKETIDWTHLVRLGFYCSTCSVSEYSNSSSWPLVRTSSGLSPLRCVFRVSVSIATKSSHTSLYFLLRSLNLRRKRTTKKKRGKNNLWYLKTKRFTATAECWWYLSHSKLNYCCSFQYFLA